MATTVSVTNELHKSIKQWALNNDCGVAEAVKKLILKAFATERATIFETVPERLINEIQDVITKENTDIVETLEYLLLLYRQRNGAQ